MEQKYPRFLSFSYFLLFITLLLYGLIQAREFLYPLAFALLLAYLIFPIVNFLEKSGFARILSILIGLFLGIAVIYGIGFFVFKRFGNIIEDFPTLKKQALLNIEYFKDGIESKFGISGDRLETILKNAVTSIFEAGSESFNRMLTSATGTLVKIGLLPVYIFLFLYYRTKFAYFILKIVPDEKERLTLNILKNIATVATRYMGGVFIVVLILCVINSAGLSLIGLQYPIFLGIISATINFIPYFGTLMGGAVPLFFALLVEPSPIIAGKVVLLFIFIQFLENNILTPNIVGSNLQINPFFIIVGLVASAMIWGIPGMLVIIPGLAVTKIICENIPSLTPIAYLLGPKGTRRHAITVENTRKLIKRIKGWFGSKA
ncbi:MAG: AI-2E family transporter [Bacteroidota bacterium]